MSAMESVELGQVLDALLKPEHFKDYCPNGLQVQGQRPIKTIITGVTANQAFLDAAIAANADAALVHHGLFWKGDDGRLTGYRFARVRALIESGMALYAYHLPLDAHPTLGNNVQLAQHLGLEFEQTLAIEPLVSMGRFSRAISVRDFAAHVSQRLGRACQVIGQWDSAVERVAWCTGAAQGFFEAAITCGAHVYLTGEISEQHVHIARETGTVFIAAGHHATERYGVQAVGTYLENTCGIAHRFIDIDSPV
jgi:dinuclear metal center YbgI/SA1388 family protein